MSTAIVHKVTEQQIDEFLSTLRSILLSAIAEKRSIRIDADSPYFEMPSDDRIQRFTTTGEMTIEIRTGLVGSGESKQERLK